MAGAFGRDALEKGPDGSTILVAPRSKRWIARRPATLTTSEHPGTAVAWGEEVFEVVEASPGVDGSVRYRLCPWEDGHAIRVVETYDAASEQAREAEQAGRRAAIYRRRLSIVLAVLAGHLPAPVQTRMEWDFGAPARAMTIASALPLFVLGMLGFIASRIAMAGADATFLPWFPEHPGLCAFLAAESGVRLWVAFVLGAPIGSIAGTVAYEVWRGLRASPVPVPEAAWRPAQPTPERASLDRFRMLEPFLALLSPPEQLQLNERFGFDPLRWGRRSAWALLTLGFINLLISWGKFLQDADRFDDFFWALAGSWLFIEQIVRLRKLGQGRPAGSVLSGLVRPLARSLMA
jgi:hypothetical protein